MQDEIEKLKKQKIERAPESTFEKKEADIGSGSATPPLHSAETEPMDPIDLLDEEEKVTMTLIFRKGILRSWRQ